MARGRPGIACAAAVVATLLLASCGSGSAPTAGSSTTRATTPSSSTPTTPTDPASTSASDPVHAVGDPGPFRAPLHTADMLIFRQQPLSDAMVRRIRQVDGVTRVERFSLAQVSIDDHAINVAAVDPATYRNYNPDAAAQFQQEWDRIAGGEMSLRPQFRRQVPQDGYVRMGTRADAPRIHVGVYAPQIPQVDAIVNDSWVKTLGMRKRQRAAGLDRHPHAAVDPQADPADRRRPGLGAADGRRRTLRARPERRPGGAPGRHPADAVGAFQYTVLTGGHIAPQPSWVASHISTETMPIIGAMTCNTLMFPQLRAALEEIRASGLAWCDPPEPVRRLLRPALHRRAPRPCPTTPSAWPSTSTCRRTSGARSGRSTARWSRSSSSYGFTWGGTWHWTDPMHFELNRMVRPG